MPNPNLKKKGILKSFALKDLILIAMLTALSIAIKVIAGSLIRMVTGPLGIPGGALAGGFYMLWLPLAIVLVQRRGAALVVAALQTLIMITTGAPGSHGAWTILTYILPALPVEAVFFFRKKGYNMLHFMLACCLANITGTFLSSQLLFRISLYPLLFTLLAAAFSGAGGGIIAYFAYTKAVSTGIIKLRAATDTAAQTPPPSITDTHNANNNAFITNDIISIKTDNKDASNIDNASNDINNNDNCNSNICDTSDIAYLTSQKGGDTDDAKTS